MKKRNSTKFQIINYILNHQITSKSELAKELNLSMPTVLTNVNELITRGVIAENGEYKSTGGRKAKSIGINKEYCYSMGVVISAKYVEMVLINLGNEIIKKKRLDFEFHSDISYCRELKKYVEEFLNGSSGTDQLLGIGITIPGIIDQKEQIVLKSHALQLENYSLQFMKQAFSVPVYFENDANAAMLAENIQKYEDAIYLSLNHTLGGAFCLDGQLFRGKNQKAGEFGHMILVPGGRKCYCGKIGCADAYCAASVLTGENENSLESFLQRLKRREKKAMDMWDDYLEHLAILISNLRMAYDMDIILGGDVGGILQNDLALLGEKVMKYNKFEYDISYLKLCTYKEEASAVGVAKHFFYEYMMKM